VAGAHGSALSMSETYDRYLVPLVFDPYAHLLAEDATNRAADALAQRFGTGPIAGRMRAFVIDVVR
jgi:hypothetical protein